MGYSVEYLCSVNEQVLDQIQTKLDEHATARGTQYSPELAFSFNRTSKPFSSRGLYPVPFFQLLS